MTALFKPFLILTWVFALVSCQHPPRPSEVASSQYPFDLPLSLAQSEEILPAGREVCRRLGLDPEIMGRCNGSAVLAASSRQTDHSLWFRKTSTGPVAGTCPNPFDFSRDREGRRVTTILCGQPLDDPVATEADLGKLRSAVEHLNATQHKTLAQHIAATELKHEMACQVGTTTSDCD